MWLCWLMRGWQGKIGKMILIFLKKIKSIKKYTTPKRFTGTI
jgi:hypothetical protein